MRVLQERRVVLTALSEHPTPVRAPRTAPVLAAAVAVAVVVADQLTKTWAEDHLQYGTSGRHLAGPLWLTLSYNSGVAFGIGRGVGPVVDAVVAVLVVALLVGVARHAARGISWSESVGFGLLAGGALSNLADRFFRHHGGQVTDFVNPLEIGGHEYWPIFNLADACIVAGILLLALRFSPASRRAR